MTPHLTSALAAAFAGVLAAGSVGCDAVDCGPGTIESQGACIPSDQSFDDTECGPGTKLGPAGTCIPEVTVVCDAETTMEQIDPVTGDVTCVGIGTVTGCAGELPCPPPIDGKITICGRLYDTQTDAKIEAVGATGVPCDPGAPTTDGPCSLKLTYVDALEFQANPTGATPHIGSPMIVDDCGRFKAENLPLSGFGFTGIAVDDAAGTADRHKLTGVALDDDNAKPQRNFSAYITRNETDVAWTTSSGITGESFANRGVLGIVFRHVAAATARVTVRRTNNPIPADDFYFSDPTSATRTTVLPSTSPQTSTGANGTVLVINSGAPADHDGVGAEPAGCRWPRTLAATIPRVVFMQIKVAETPAGVECP